MINNYFTFFNNIFFLNFFDVVNDPAGQQITAILKPIFDTIMYVLYSLLVLGVIYKIVMLAKDLAQSSDEPEKRAEIKKAFIYSLSALIIAGLAAPIVHKLADIFIFNK
jgi:hypothetical protein